MCFTNFWYGAGDREHTFCYSRVSDPFSPSHVLQLALPSTHNYTSSLHIDLRYCPTTVFAAGSCTSVHTLSHSARLMLLTKLDSQNSHSMPISRHSLVLGFRSAVLTFAACGVLSVQSMLAAVLLCFIRKAKYGNCTRWVAMKGCFQLDTSLPAYCHQAL